MLKPTRQVYQRALECDADIYHFHDPELIPVVINENRGKRYMMSWLFRRYYEQGVISKPLRKPYHLVSIGLNGLWFV